MLSGRTDPTAVPREDPRRLIELGVAGLALGRWPSARLSVLPSIVFLLLVEHAIHRQQEPGFGRGLRLLAASGDSHWTSGASHPECAAWTAGRMGDDPGPGSELICGLRLRVRQRRRSSVGPDGDANIHSTIMVMRPERGGGL